MPRKNKMSNRPELLDTQLSALISLVKDLSPEARIKIPHAHYKDEDAHVSIYPPPTMGAEEVNALNKRWVSAATRFTWKLDSLLSAQCKISCRVRKRTLRSYEA